MTSPTTSPAAPARTVPTREDRRARLGVALLFFTNGALFANILPRYPAIKDGLDLSNADFGLAVAAFPVGALVAGLGAGWLIRRFRSSRVAVIGTVITGVAVLLAGLAPVGGLLAAGFLLAGAMDAIVDVSQNSHGLRVQYRYRRSILNSFHAVWSIGAVLGGLMGGAAAGLGIPVVWHLGASAVIFAIVALVSYPLLLAGPEPAEGAAESTEGTADGTAASASVDGTVAPGADVTAGAGPGAAPVASGPGDATRASSARGGRPVSVGFVAKWGVLLALVVIASSGAVVEDAGSTWAALYLGSLGAGVTVAALGFVSLQGAQFVGRLLGDGMVDRFGQKAVARAGGVFVAVGMGVALAFPSVVGTIVGFAAAGFGVATLIPAAMHAADNLPGFRAGTGLTLVSWLLRLGFLASPPIVGFVADSVGLRFGLLLVPVVGVAVVLLAGVLEGRRARGSAPRGS
ncbi:MFS transporter [Frigoribacterium sp. Leaf186]|jgi:MFS family permease|uniref:MFS transporter n=1 Tax=Frigoribacterium sp. Leaf186 TaxID=1736293 RepID=UPI0006F4061F|nr:MFS transporter [Frigoribacterium sp. Leaf186]KQS17637.1 fucose permease [Frigoribacterium sp. Leaf186]